MVKLALRVKRRFSKQRGRGRAVRAKTFQTVEAAQHWAKENDIAKPEIVAKGKKFVVANA